MLSGHNGDAHPFFHHFLEPSLVPFSVDFGSRLGSQNRPKIDLWTHKASRVAFFERFFWRASFGSGFGLDLGSFFDEKSMFFSSLFFRSSSRFFRPGEPHETLLFTYRKPLFHFFTFSFFRRKNVKNREKNNTQEKTPKMTPGRTPNGPHF